MTIRILPPHVAVRIAAGEVVERPASVVKELVENSLDAQATSISIEVSGGGIDLIRVVDNGVGIPSDQVEMAFERYATSKLSEAEDLEAISTLGFRGEALPSIAAVSQASLLTRTPDEEAGTLVEVPFGKAGTKKRQGCPVGTSVTVRRLFQNVPARRKFLRSVASETSRIHALVTRYALAYPEVRVTLIVEGSTAFASPGSGNLRETLAAVYDADAAQAMLEVAPAGEEEHGTGIGVSGFISPPSLTRANRSYMTFFVNRRWVQNRLLGYALEQAYHGFLIESRHPISVLNITMPYQDVDVNVHPAKSEVRFRREDLVFSALQRAVRRTLTTASTVHQMQPAQRDYTGKPVTTLSHGPAFWPRELARPPQVESRQVGTHAAPQPLRGVLPVLRVLGQVQNTYIVAEGPDGVYMIDQHAAHERVLFEKIASEIKENLCQSQGVLEPVTVVLTPEQEELVQSHLELLTQSGFQLEPFGPGTFLVRGVPSVMTDGDPKGAFLAVLDLLSEGGGFQDWHERLAYSIACHAAIRAGKVLAHQEMAEMVRQLEMCQQPHTCPHGRPTMIHLSSGHLEREFGRR